MIDCDCFPNAMKRMTTALAVPISTRRSAQNITVDNMNLSTFKKRFMECMDTLFSDENYCLRFFNGDCTVTWYTKRICPEL